jgi:hypothetical protein
MAPDKIEQRRCSAVTLHGEQCTKRPLPTSRYCWQHVDKAGALATFVISSLLSIGLTLATVAYQDRAPDISATCVPPADGNPAELTCTVANSGRAEGREVFVSFNGFLLDGTRVRSQPQDGVEVQESDAPAASPATARVTKAFAVRVTRVRAGDSVSFTVYSDEPATVRAARQTLFLRRLEEGAFSRFLDAVAKEVPDAAKLDRAARMSASRKDNSFFHPAVVAWANGERAVKFLSSAEINAQAIFQDLYSQYKRKFIQVFADGGQYAAPVVRIKTTTGVSTYASFPAFPGTYVSASFPINTLIREGQVEMAVPVPQYYEADTLAGETGDSDLVAAFSGHTIPFLQQPLTVDGRLDEAAWLGADEAILTTGDSQTPVARVLLMNDVRRLYVGIDALFDTKDTQPTAEAPWGDYVKMILDMNGDGLASTGDLECAITQQSRVLFCRKMKDVAADGPLLRIQSVGSIGFFASRALTAAHRTFEAAFSLDEFHLKPGGTVSLGFSIYSAEASTVAIPRQLSRPLLRVNLGQPPPLK